MDDEIILISDDEDDADVVILISSDEENEDKKSDIIKSENHSHRIKKESEVEDERSPTSDDEGFCRSSASEDDDLPDIPNLIISPRALPCEEKGRNSKTDVSCRQERKCPVNLPYKEDEILEESILEPSVAGCRKQRRSPVRSPSKRLKLEEESAPIESSAEEEALARVLPVLSEIKDDVSATLWTNNKQIITNNLMTGELRRDVLNLCSRDIDCCFTTHTNEEKPLPTSIQSIDVWDVMMEDNNLTHYALRSMCKAVHKGQFLHHAACDLLIEHIHGSEEKMEMPDLQNVHLGISILHKQLRYHPTCKRMMRQYYLKICSKWWPCIMKSANQLLIGSVNSCVSRKEEEVSLPESPKVEEALHDLADMAKKEECRRHDSFKKISKAEKINRISILMKYLTSVMNSNVVVWLMKYRHDNKTAAFRKDISPIVAEITWGNDVLNFGGVNGNVKLLFQLFSKSSKEQSLHSLLSVMINMKAAVIHRREKCSYPEMGPLTRGFAYGLFSVIQASPHVEENVSPIRPHWLRFLVGSYLLDLEEPPNYYKAKERIHQLLLAKDKGHNQKSFDVEKLCFYMLDSMSKMMGFTPSPIDLFPSIKIVGENEEDLWFREMLSNNFLEKNIQTLLSSFSLPPVQCDIREGYNFEYIKGYVL